MMFLFSTKEKHVVKMGRKVTIFYHQGKKSNLKWMRKIGNKK